MLLVLLLSVVAVYAGGIGDVKELIAFAKAVNSGASLAEWQDDKGVVCLECDIDMKKAKKLPVILAFNGVLDGKGYALKNWKTTNALIHELKFGGEVRNLRIDGSCSMKLAGTTEELEIPVGGKALAQLYAGENPVEDVQVFAYAEKKSYTVKAPTADMVKVIGTPDGWKAVLKEMTLEVTAPAAEAEAEQKRVNAKGEADAIFAKMEAEAKGLYEMLAKQASGYDKMIQAAGGDATKAYSLLLLEKLPELVKTQVEAIKGINIDKVTVWDNGGTADGKTNTANFLAGLMKSIPPLNDLFDQAGMSLPEYLAKKKEEIPTAEECKE